MMTTRYIVFLLISLLALPLSAQTEAQAKALYQAGKYEEAKPALKKLLKAAPSNANYNLWYGVCCLETGEPEAALKPLQTAVRRRATSGQLHLARAYDALYRYEDAIETFEEYISELEKRKRPTDEAEALLDKTRANLRMLKGVEQVCLVDSFIVGKANFLSAYRLSSESGQLAMYGEYFDGDATKQTAIPEENEAAKYRTVYETELANRIYYAEFQPADSTTSILTSNKLIDQWSAGKPLPDNINAARNTGFPYALSDGVTIYYAADGAESLGGLDIFVTRYNTNTDSYLTPENVGMPFNSPYNDYMYVVDEFNNLGWFATDRHQPADSVCIYVFVPNSTKQVYDFETMDRQKMVRLARLTSISDSWTEENANQLHAARERLKQAIASASNAPTTKEAQSGPNFVIDDDRTIHTLTDFRSAEARRLYTRYAERQKEFARMEARLDLMRETYADSDKQRRATQTAQILDLEKQVEAMRKELKEEAKAIRRAEKQ